jgi:hypothetical protein
VARQGKWRWQRRRVGRRVRWVILMTQGRRPRNARRRWRGESVLADRSATALATNPATAQARPGRTGKTDKTGRRYKMIRRKVEGSAGAWWRSQPAGHGGGMTRRTFRTLREGHVVEEVAEHTSQGRCVVQRTTRGGAAAAAAAAAAAEVIVAVAVVAVVAVAAAAKVAHWISMR